MKLRSYAGMQDFYAMLDLLSAGSRANNGTHYVHRGDLQWWLFYTDTPPALWQSRIRLWTESDRLIGWALLSPEEDAFDVYTVPALRGSSQEDEMLSAVVTEMSALDELNNIWVAEDDEVRIQWFNKHGFKVADEHMPHFTRFLSDPLPAPQLPAGFSLRASRGNEMRRMRVCGRLSRMRRSNRRCRSKNIGFGHGGSCNLRCMCRNTKYLSWLHREKSPLSASSGRMN